VKGIFQFLSHRGLTLSILALFFGLFAFGFLPEHRYRFQQHGAAYLTSAGITASVGLAICALTLGILLKGNRSGYSSSRCALATLLWALACVPVLFLTAVVIEELLR
jgi:hypothetical protein